MSQATDDLDILIAALPPEEATLYLVKFLFKQLAEIQTTVDMLVPLTGAIGAKLGLSGDDLARLARMEIRT